MIIWIWYRVESKERRGIRLSFRGFNIWGESGGREVYVRG